ncbi:DUF4870 domain-containing protein [Flavobacterium sp.]|uniref:DUF4870 domain-containing protein n=1 Tax=Flavobacterium sp. TaxID=239 RepID=UPI00261B0A55|nr:DUF4870 domain-containing protein [Flavobacterium sp.]
MNANERNIGAILHLSALGQYLFPFGNFIIPAFIWSAKKEASSVLEEQGRSVLNFQLSVFVYTLVLIGLGLILTIGAFTNGMIAFQWDDHSFAIRNFEELQFSTGLIVGISAFVLFTLLKITEFVLVVYGALEATRGRIYHYPLSIPFLRQRLQNVSVQTNDNVSEPAVSTSE